MNAAAYRLSGSTISILSWHDKVLSLFQLISLSIVYFGESQAEESCVRAHLLFGRTPEDGMCCWTNDFEHTALTSRFVVQGENGKKEFYSSTTIASH